jgi:hypothetical protein
MVSSAGRYLELDGYNKELALAFEHQGIQHFEAVPYFQTNGETLERRRKLDETKRAACAKHGVLLLEIPYHVPTAQLSDWIGGELRRIGAPEPKVAVANIGDITGDVDNSLSRLWETARERGGECLSAVWLGVAEKHRFRWGLGHEWEATGSNIIRRKSWCPTCGYKRVSQSRMDKVGLERLRAAAAAKGGELLTKEYSGADLKYDFRCERGHVWNTVGRRVLGGNWCPTCAGWHPRSLEPGLDRLAAVAAENGGTVLTLRFLGRKKSHSFRCHLGHEWETTASNVFSFGLRCPTCKVMHEEEGRLTALVEAAKGRGGELVGTKFLGYHKRHLWRCGLGHEWEMIATSVLYRGSWCPTCAERLCKSTLRCD